MEFFKMEFFNREFIIQQKKMFFYKGPLKIITMKQMLRATVILMKVYKLLSKEFMICNLYTSLLVVLLFFYQNNYKTVYIILKEINMEQSQKIIIYNSKIILFFHI